MPIQDDRYEAFWRGFYDFMSARSGPVGALEATDENFVETGPIRPGFKLCAAFDTVRRRRKVEVLITGGRGKDIARKLFAQRTEIENDLGRGLKWKMHLKSKWKVIMWDDGTDVLSGPPSERYVWYADNLESLHRVFVPKIDALL